MEVLDIIGTDVAFGGQFSGTDAASIPPGGFLSVENLEKSFGVTRARAAHIVKVTASGLPSGEQRGGIVVDLTSIGITGPDWMVFVAIKTGGTVQIWRYWTSWVEMTAATGRFGNTRFVNADELDVPYAFAQVTSDMTSRIANFNTGNRPYVIVQNGKSYPRVIEVGTGTTEGYLASIHSPLKPSPVGSVNAFATWVDYLSFGSTETWTSVATLTASSTGFSMTVTSGTTRALTLTISTTVSSGATSSYVSNQNVTSYAFAQQLHCLWNCNDPFIWQKIKLEGYFGSSWIVLHDPTATAYSSIIREAVDVSEVRPSPVGGAKTVAPSIAVDLVGKTLFRFAAFNPATYGTISGFKVTWLASAPTTTTTLSIIAFGASGQIEAGTDWAMSYINRSMSESPATIARFIGGAEIRTIGAAEAYAGRLPEIPGAVYSYSITYPQVDISDGPRFGQLYYTRRQGGTWQLNFGIGPFYTSAVPVGTVLGSSTQIYSWTDWPTVGAGFSVERDLPTREHLCIPIGNSMQVSNGRLWVGGGKISSSETVPTGYYVSRFKNPFGFQPRPFDADGKVSPEQGAWCAMQGETVLAFASVPGQRRNNETNIIFTNRGVHEAGGTSILQLIAPNKVSSFGTLSPRSVAVDGERVFYLGADRQVRIVGVAEPLTRNRVDDKLAAITAARLPFAAGMVVDQKYVLGISEATATTNNIAVVMDFRNGSWVTWRGATSSIAYEHCQTQIVGSEIRGMFFGSAGSLWDAQSTATAEDGMAIPIRLTLRELHNGLFMEQTVEEVEVVGDAFAGTLAVTRTYRDRSGTIGTEDSRLNMTAISGQLIVARRDGTPSGAAIDATTGEGAGRAAGVTVGVTGSVAPGWRLFGMRLKVTESVPLVEGR